MTERDYNLKTWTTHGWKVGTKRSIALTDIQPRVSRNEAIELVQNERRLLDRQSVRDNKLRALAL